MSVSLEEIKKNVDELGTLFQNDFKKAVEDSKNEIKRFGTEGAETKALLEKLSKRMDTVEDEANNLLKRLQNGVKETEEKSEADRHAELFVKKMFTKNMTRKESEEYNALEAKSMQTDIAEDGGVLMPVNMERRIIEKIYETSPITGLAQEFSLSEGDFTQLPRETEDIAVGGWAANERYTVSESNNTKVDMVNIYAHELWAEPRITQKMIEDSAIDIQAYVQRKIQDKFTREMNSAFVDGTGVNEPRGFLTGLASAQVINSGSATSFDADDLLTLDGSLKEGYQDGSVFAFHRLTRTYIRKFTAGDDNYLWQPGLQNGNPASLLGKPYRLFPDLAAPSVSTNNFASADKPVVLANWSRFYGIVRRRGIRIVRDELTSKPYVKYWVSVRVGGDRLQDEAGVVLNCA